MREAVVEWPAWYEEDFDRRARLNPRHAVIVGYNLNDFRSNSGNASSQINRLLDLSKPVDVAASIRPLFGPVPCRVSWPDTPTEPCFSAQRPPRGSASPR